MFSYSVVMNDPAGIGGSKDNLLVALVQDALQEFAGYITGAGIYTVQLTLHSSPLGTADGGATSSSFVGTVNTAFGPRKLFQPSSIFELTTGTHVSGTASDASINIDPNYLANILYLDPSPTFVNGSFVTHVPANMVDGLSVMRHELAHGLGFAGFTGTDGSIGVSEELFDTFIRHNGNGTADFIGPNAMAVYGGPVPLTTLNNGEGYAHIANSSNEPAGQDLMNGVAIMRGQQYNISNLDLAILRDAGAPVTSFVGGVQPGKPQGTGLSGNYNVTRVGGTNVFRDKLTGAAFFPVQGADTFSFSDRIYGSSLSSAANFGLNPTGLRDFDGNNLGTADRWELKGYAAVVQNGGLDYILVNPAIGRFAEVQPLAGSGTVDLNRHGAGGDSRVVGIYEDPLIKLGVVQKGSPFDSQVRFQNDLLADRLQVLGAADYDQDTFTELFFKVQNNASSHADDVYLRAIMQVDGNIQYANYMNATQFGSYMATNHVPTAVYADWQQLPG